MKIREKLWKKNYSKKVFYYITKEEEEEEEEAGKSFQIAFRFMWKQRSRLKIKRERERVVMENWQFIARDGIVLNVASNESQGPRRAFKENQ